MPTIPELLPDAEAILAPEPEELAGPLLEVLCSLNERDGNMNKRNFMLWLDGLDYLSDRLEDVKKAFMEAWVWLEGERLLAPNPNMSDGWFFVTKRGQQQVETQGDPEAYRCSNLLPRQLLHPRIAQRVRATFLRGAYDMAVLEAFKQVEVAVREAGQFDVEAHGMDLMRRAFKPFGGPLSDPSSPKGEQEAESYRVSRRPNSLNQATSACS